MLRAAILGPTLCLAAMASLAVIVSACTSDGDAEGVKFTGRGSSSGSPSGGGGGGGTHKLNWESYPGTVVDPKTKLMWQRKLDGKQRTWEEAKQYCKDLVLANLDDWRLPHKDDLCTIFLLEGTVPAIDLQAFPDTPAAPFWTLTLKTPTNAWGVAFDKASALECQAGYAPFHRLHYVRCVR